MLLGYLLTHELLAILGELGRVIAKFVFSYTSGNSPVRWIFRFSNVPPSDNYKKAQGCDACVETASTEYKVVK